MTPDTGRLPSSQPFDHLVYLRVFEGCNLRCAHCFIPSNPRRFAPERFADVSTMLSGRIPDGSTVLLQWHGGEPTLMGVDYVRQGISDIHASGERYTWRHGIQTNMMLYDARWRDLFHEHFGSEAGISWDPIIRMDKSGNPNSHPAVRKTFEANLERMIQDGITPYVVVTVTKTLFEAYPNPFEFFAWWRERGVQHVHLERITKTGYARTNWDWLGLSNAEYSQNMARWAAAYAVFKRNNPAASFFLSPFENLLDSVKSTLNGIPKAAGCWSGACDTRFHTIDGDGYKAGCTALTSEDGNKNAAPGLPPKLNASFADRRDLRIFNCGACRFRSACKTGCLALDFDDGSGECSGGLRLFEKLEHIAQQERTP